MKKFLLLALLLTVITSSVHAEQPAAEEYRQMFRSGNFYVEYKISVPEKITTILGTEKISSPIFTLAGQDGNRMQRIFMDKMFIAHLWNYYSGWLNLSSVLSDAALSYRRTNLQYADHGNKTLGFKKLLFGADKKNYPDALFKDGKYYRFRQDSESANAIRKIYGDGGAIYAKVLPQEDLNSPTLNADDEWDYIRSDLALPDELAVFCWDEPFRDNFTPAPTYNGSSKRTVDDKEYDCDQYLVDIKSLAGTVIAQEVYNMLYDGGKLVRVQKYLLRDGKEELVLEVDVKNISATVPEDAFKIGKKIKVYAAENGDMQDLLEQPVLVETLGVN